MKQIDEKDYKRLNEFITITNYKTDLYVIEFSYFIFTNFPKDFLTNDHRSNF